MTMMLCFTAPGKCILFGEHAVVYGHPAVAAALSLNTMARLQLSGHGDAAVLQRQEAEGGVVELPLAAVRRAAAARAPRLLVAAHGADGGADADGGAEAFGVLLLQLALALPAPLQAAWPPPLIVSLSSSLPTGCAASMTCAGDG